MTDDEPDEILYETPNKGKWGKDMSLDEIGLKMRIGTLEQKVAAESLRQDNSLEDVYERIRALEAYMCNLGRKYQAKEKTSGMTFSQALVALKGDARLSMWNTDEIWVHLVDEGGSRIPCFWVKTMSGQFAPWTPHNGEILSNNWRVLEELEDE